MITAVFFTVVQVDKYAVSLIRIGRQQFRVLNQEKLIRPIG